MISNADSSTTSAGNFDTQSLSHLLASLQPMSNTQDFIASASINGGPVISSSAAELVFPTQQFQGNAINKPNLRVNIDAESPHSSNIGNAMDSVASSDHHKPSDATPHGLSSSMITSSTPQPNTPHQPTNVFVAGLPSSWDEKKLKERFQEYGGIVSVRIVPCRRFGFVMFKNPQAARAAIAGAHQTRPSASSQPIHVTLSMHDEGVDDVANERLFIRGLPEWATQAHLRNVFAKFGNIEEASLLINNAGHCKGTGFVQFTRVEDAEAAMAGGRTARIENFDFELEIKYSETAEVHQQRQERNRERYRAKNSSNNTTPTGSEIPAIKIHGKAAFANAATALLGPPPPPPPPPMQPPQYAPQNGIAPLPPPPQYSAPTSQWTPPPVLAPPPPPMHHHQPPPPPPQQPQQLHTHLMHGQLPIGQPLPSPHHHHHHMAPHFPQQQQQQFMTTPTGSGSMMMMQTPQFGAQYHQPPPPPHQPLQQMHPQHPAMYASPHTQAQQMTPMGVAQSQGTMLAPSHHQMMAAPSTTISPKSNVTPTVQLFFPASGDMCFTSPVCSEDVVRQVLQTKCGITPEKVLLIDPSRNSYAVRLPDRNLHAPVAQSLVNCVFSTGHALEVALFS
jgi:RNA recognition motif-containing protein